MGIEFAIAGVGVYINALI